MELGGSLGYADAARGLSVVARGRTLVAHGEAAYHEWGAGASVRLDPDEPAAHGWMVAVWADGPGSATLVCG